MGSSPGIIALQVTVVGHCDDEQCQTHLPGAERYRIHATPTVHSWAVNLLMEISTHDVKAVSNWLSARVLRRTVKAERKSHEVSYARGLAGRGAKGGR